MNRVWYDGVDGYLCNILEDNIHTLKVQEQVIPLERSIHAVFSDALSIRQTKTVEVLYSGGLDSELVLYVCSKNNIPVKAITMRLIAKGITINMVDMYYSTKFCRDNDIEQKIVDLDVTKFYESGEYIKYLDPYLINEPHIATHLWLFEQCTGFPVFGGEYTWPWVYPNVPRIYSPIRYNLCHYDSFLYNNSIHGIGSMLNRSFESNSIFANAHINQMLLDETNTHGHGDYGIITLKKAMFDSICDYSFEPRLRSYGWENLDPRIHDQAIYRNFLKSRYPEIESYIEWGSMLASYIGGEPGKNSRRK